MTKKDYLRKAPYSERVMTWKALGANMIDDSTKIYLENQIYYVNIPLSELNGAVIYCVKSYTGNIDWLSAKLFDINYGEISFGYNVVSPYFTVILTPLEFAEVDVNSPEFINGYKSFIPYKEYDLMEKVTINEDDYRIITSVLGSPFIREEELEYTRDEICDLAIRPALEEYFHWIPATTHIEEEVGQMEMEIEFPNESCYGVVGISLQQYGGSMNGNMLSPLFYGMEQSLYSGLNYTGLSGSYTGSKAPKTQTNTVSNVITSRANAQALINYGRRVHFEGPYDPNDPGALRPTMIKPKNKWIRVWSNTQGVLNIWFARRTLNFNDVIFQHRTRVFEYSQACVKELFGNLRRQSKSDIPGLVDYKDWITEAKETKKEIRDEWKKIPKWAGVERGSL